MKQKCFLAFLLFFSVSYAKADLDTLWKTNLHCSYESYVVSPDERYFASYGRYGWDLGKLEPFEWTKFSNPVKIFNAQNGQFITAIYDSNEQNHVTYVDFSSDSKRMLVSFSGNPSSKRMIVIYNVENTIIPLDTIYVPDAPFSEVPGDHYQYSISTQAKYSPNMQWIVVNNRLFYDANTFELKKSFFYIPNTSISYPTYITSMQETSGVFCKNSSEYIFTCKYFLNPPFNSSGEKGIRINLVDSTLLFYNSEHNYYSHKSGCNLYAFVLSSNLKGHKRVLVRNIISDQIILDLDSLLEVPRIEFIYGDEYIRVGNKIYKLPEYTFVCEVDNDVKFISRNMVFLEFLTEYEEYKAMALQPCWTYTGVAPKIKNESKVYPMPAKDEVNFEFQDEVEILKLSIYTVHSSQIGDDQYSYVSNEKSVSINCNNLQSGVYLIKFETSKGIIFKQFCKY